MLNKRTLKVHNDSFWCRLNVEIIYPAISNRMLQAKSPLIKGAHCGGITRKLNEYK